MINQIYFGNKLLKFDNYDKLYSYVEKHHNVYNCNIANYEEYINIINDKLYESQLSSSDINKVISIINRKYNIILTKDSNNTIKFNIIKNRKKLFDLDNFKNIIESLKCLGWNYSYSTIDDGEGLPKKYKNIEIIEEKYNDSIDIIVFINALNDIEIEIIPDSLYHITLDCFSKNKL